MWAEINESSLGVKERLKTAAQIWSSLEAGKDKGKRVGLVQWSIDLLISLYGGKNKKSKKIEIKRRDLCRCWSFLVDCLKDIRDEEREWITFTPLFIEILSVAIKEGMEDKEVKDIIFKCVEAIFLWRPVPAVIMRHDLMLPLVIALLCDVQFCYNNVELINIALKHQSYLQRIHSNPRKVYSSICNNLSSFLSLVHQQDKTFRSSIEDILGYLFTSDFLPEYGSVLALEATPTLGLATPTSFVNQMFDTLSQISEHSSSLIVNGALPFMFEILLKQNKVTGRKLHKEKEFLFFLKLLQTLGVHITMAMVSKEMKEEGEREEEETGEENKGEEDMTVVDNYIESKSHLRSINQVSLMMESVIGSESDPVLDNIGKLLSLLKEYGVYQITEDKDDGQFQKLQLLSNIISMKTTLNNIDTVFMCLESMLRLNHLLIEPLLPDIWSLLLTLPKELVENGKFIANFSDTVASFYGKLRQIPLFLSCVLGSIKVSQEAVKQLGIKPLFYQSTEKILSMLLRILPVAQSLEIFDSFLKHFKEIQLPLVDQITATKRSSAKKRRRESNSSSLIAPHASSSSVLSGLLMSMDAFSLFISNIPLDLFCKGRQHEGMREKLTGIVNEVYTPLLLATLQNADFLFPAVLYFQLILTKYYHSVSTIERGAESIKRMNHSSVQLSWSPTNDLCLLYNGEALPMPSTLLPISEYLMRCLCVLELRFTKETSLQIEGTLNHLLSVPLSSTSSLTNWNGQILSINAANVTAAVHLLLFKNLPFLYSMMESCPSSSPFDQLATIIHKSLIQCTDPDPDTDTDSDSDSNEVCRVIQELLLSDSYSQMKSLHVSLVKCVSGHMYSLWPKKYSKVIKTILLCDDEVNSPPIQCLISDDERIIKKMETFIQHLTPSLMIMESVPLSFSQENDIFIVKVLTILIHWSMTALVLVNSSIILNHQEPVVHLLLLLARTSEVTLLNRKKEKRKSYDHKNHRRDWGSACKWFKELLTELEEKDEELSQKSCDLKSAVLFSMEMLLKLELLTNPVSDEKKKRQDTPTVNGECITYWNSIEEQVITNVSPNGPIPQSSPLSLLSVLSTDESFIFLLASQSSILELLSTETPMEEQLIGLLLSEKDGGRGSISHYNTLCKVQSSLKALMDDTDAMDQVLESSFIQSPTDFDGQLCFCLLWLMFLKLSSSISHEKRVLTRHWLGKVVTKCVHILISQQSFLVTNKRNALIKLSVQLLTQLASLPRQVGLDAQMLHVLYHGLSIINESCIKDCSVLLATESLILVLVQTHSQTLSLSPLMTVIFKFICVIVSFSQELTAVGSSVSDDIKLCILTLNNLMELFCRQEWFAKFAVHCVAQYITNIKLSPIQPEIKGLLLNGVFYLIKILSSADISFLKNSVNDETCSFFQELLQQHKKFNRFKGKI